ncbi:MAG: TonB-dependent receptor [Bacteroidota bacterium]
MYYTLILSILFFFIQITVYSQKVEISGKITDPGGEPVMYASISLMGTLDGTTSDERGKFSFFTVKKGQQTITGSFIGYESTSKTIFIEGDTINTDLVITPKVTLLREVTITAGTFEAGDTKRAVVMRPVDIGTTAGATGDITRAIETLPGVQNVGESSGLFVRGGSGSECKVLIDEMVVQNPYYSPVPDIKQRGRFDPFMFSGTVFSTGGYSALYGQALSSVLALKTSSLADSTNTGGGLHAYGLNLFHTHRWENTSFYAKGEYNNLGPYNNTFRQLTDWKKSPENLAATFNFRHRFSKDDMLKLFATCSRTSLSIYYDHSDSSYQKQLFKLNNDNLYINSSYKKFFNDERWSLFTGLSYSKDIDEAFMDTLNMSENEMLTQGKLIISNSSVPGITFYAGGEFQLRKVTGINGNLTGTIDETYLAGYLEGNWTITPRLGTRAGLRYEYSGCINNKTLAPRLSLAYKTGSYSQVSFAYGSFYEIPENEYLYYEKNLKFENATHYIINYQVMKDKRIFRIEFYDKEYKKLVRFLPDEENGFDNLGYGYARGIDLFWRDEKTIPGADYWISYSYIDSRRLYHDYPVLSTPEFVSKHNLSVVYKHWIKRIQTMAGFTWSFASGRPYYNPQRPDTEFHNDLTPPYNNLSINISKMLRIFGRSSVIYASADNLLGENHIFGYHYLPGGQDRIPIRPSGIRSFFIGCFISTY